MTQTPPSPGVPYTQTGGKDDDDNYLLTTGLMETVAIPDYLVEAESTITQFLMITLLMILVLRLVRLLALTRQLLRYVCKSWARVPALSQPETLSLSQLQSHSQNLSLSQLQAYSEPQPGASKSLNHRLRKSLRLQKKRRRILSDIWHF